jgi:PHD/YefM family antitoxin component YafN of YafNO toxin-antitoxin module
MLDLTNSYSLTDFQRNAKEFLQHLSESKTPLLLTVNGKVQAVLIDPKTFQKFAAYVAAQAGPDSKG